MLRHKTERRCQLNTANTASKQPLTYTIRQRANNGSTCNVNQSRDLDIIDERAENYTEIAETKI
jgi:hypothetical protein